MVKYVEIIFDIKNKIESGEYAAWSSLEGEVILANRYQTTRNTIRKALAVLKEEGYIHTRQGSGIYVNPRELYNEQKLLTLSDRFEKVKLDSKVLLYEIVLGDEALLSKFNFDRPTEFVHYKRVRYLDHRPMTIEETWMPRHMIPWFKIDDLYGSVMSRLEEHFHISHDFKQVSAIALSKESANLLNRSTHDLSLQIIHQVYLVRSVLIQYTVEIQADNMLGALAIRSKI